MTRKVLHSLTILVLALFMTQGRLLMAQSANGDGGTRDSLGLRQERRRELAPVNSRATSSKIPKSDRDAGAIGLAKTKVYQFRSIDYPGSVDTKPYDFNGKTVVGCTVFDFFTFQGSSYVHPTVPGATTGSCGLGINTSGKIVGNYRDSSYQIHGFFYDGSGYTTIDYPGAGYSEAWGINDAGLIVGRYYANNVYQGFLYDNGTFTGINYPGAVDTYAYGINSSGDIVGSYDYCYGCDPHGFLLSNGTYYSLDVPLANATFAQGINDAGTIAGYYIDTTLAYCGFIYAGGVFTTVDVSGAPHTEVWRINNHGNVVGIVVDSLGETHGIIGK